MKIKQWSKLYVLLLFVQLNNSCSKDNVLPDFQQVPADQVDVTPTGGEEEEEEEETEESLPSAGTVELINPLLTEDDLILVNDAGANRVYLMNKEAGIVHEWPLNSKGIGNDAYLLPSGKLLASMQADDPIMEFGGQGGKIQIMDKDGTIEWNFDYSSEEAETHHDVELLPNGNVIALVWEKRDEEQAREAGSNLDIAVFPEAVIEVNPGTDEIVWEWHAWDHLIQDHDDTQLNFGSIADNPQLINLNYVSDKEGDIMHANGIAYDEEQDLIFISVNFYHEVWVIDHSTTTEEAAAHAGGNYGKGGDLLYRFGNPSAYDNPFGERLFYNNHFPNLLTGEDKGRMLIFSNSIGNGVEQSKVYELQLPAVYTLTPNADNEPEVLWSFTDPQLFSGKVSGAVKLPNSNVLITEGDFGFWEVTQDKKPVWKFSAEGFFWRGYHYAKNDQAILNLDLGPIP